MSTRQLSCLDAGSGHLEWARLLHAMACMLCKTEMMMDVTLIVGLLNSVPGEV